ncbi:MAG: hypothetical protein VX733_01290 [Candidatus Latescibacterota bacterium]|nr:hypothetical protein [Candidatus Latescibacterota bacterium]
MKICCRILPVAGFALYLFSLQPAAAADDVHTVLENLQAKAMWGEIVLEGGQVRQVRVQGLDEKGNVSVREVIGPLQLRLANYAVASIRSARTLGPHRISLRLSPYRAPKSVPLALAIEFVLPGFGYFYAGEARQGYALLAVSAAAVATGVVSGEDGAAGWIPFTAWTKVASMVQLRDEVLATNSSYQERKHVALIPGAMRVPTVSLGALHVRF